MLWITILGGLLIMMGQQDRSEALFYYFRLGRSGSGESSAAADRNARMGCHTGRRCHSATGAYVNATAIKNG